MHQTLSATRERWLVSSRPSGCFGTCIQSCLDWRFWSSEGFRICQWQEVEACSSHQHCSTQLVWDTPCSICVLQAALWPRNCPPVEMSCVSESKSMVWQWAYSIMLHLPAFCKTIQFHPCCRCHAAHTDPESNEFAASSLQSQPCWLIQTPQSGSRTWCRGDFWMPLATHLRTQRPRGQGRARQGSTQPSLWWGHLTYWLGPGMWGTTGTELSPSVGTSQSVVALPLGSHPPSW